MQKTIPKIISINPHTRYLGIAIFYGADLREWSVKSLSGDNIKRKAKSAKATIEKLIEYFDIDIISIKRVDSIRGSKNLSLIIDVIKRIGRKKNLQIDQYTLSEVKRILLPNEKTNKNKLIEKVITQYPSLDQFAQKEKKNKNIYYTRMFEAVAVGLVSVRSLDRKNIER